MEFEVLHRSKKKKFLIAGCFLVAILVAVAVGFTFAKYKVTASIPLASGTINYVPYDFSVLAMYQLNEDGGYDAISKMPSGDFTINTEKSYCTVDGSKDTNAKLETIDGNHTIANLQVGSKCYLYFDADLGGNAGEEILAHYKTIKTRSLPFTTSTTVTDTTTGTIYKAQDDWGDTYYFAGNPQDNWVKFAGYYWRIVRINGDGSIRLIYNGTSTATTGTSTMISGSQAFNSSRNRSEYVGYMYTTNEQHGNTTNSDIKTVVDTWYNNNLKSQESKISKEAGFCGEREMASGTSWDSQPSNTIYYAARERLDTNNKPTLKCSNSADLYTVNESSKGNHALSNPIGLITADEIAMAGGVYGSNNSSYYLYTGQKYWTMSPFNFIGNAIVFYVYSNGSLSNNNVPRANGVRPVINIASDVKVTGSGTSDDPYVVI
ncbi:unknown [Mycoplasma sp. CAG:776]|nr:unknown [Mycoplasma sp. CAG:776]